MVTKRLLALAALGAGVLGAGGSAWAVDCSSLPAPFYGIGGSAQRPLLARLATRLSALAQPRTLIYQAPGACVGLNAVIHNTRIMGQATYWSAQGAEALCDLPLTGQLPDFATLGNAATLCPGVTALPAGVGDFEGPITTWNVFVPRASSQQSISAEGAYFVFGFGRESGVTPWTDEAAIIRRDANSAAQIVLGLATGLPVERFRGVDAMTNSRSVSLVAMASNAEAAIGFASADNADANRATVRTLAWQHTGQTCGYWPDSTETSFDKRNVREGSYWLWTGIHFFTRVDGAGQAVNPLVRDLAGWFNGRVTPPAEVPVLDLTIQSGTVPLCAMHVRRANDLGPLASYAPPAPCGCYFDRIATGSTACAACTDNTQCTGSARVCRNGYCEVN